MLHQNVHQKNNDGQNCNNNSNQNNWSTTIRPISSMKIKTLLRQIAELDKSDHVSLFEILHRSTNSYSVNTNGVFCPMSLLDPETVDDMIIYVENARRRKLFERETNEDAIVNNQNQRNRIA